MRTETIRRCLFIGLLGLAWESAGAANLPGETPEGEATGAHHRVLGWTRDPREGEGASTAAKPEVVQIEPGLHRFENGRWVEADELIEIQGRRAVARRTLHRVTWEANANVPGAIRIELPDGGKLRGQCLGLGYYDPSSGKSTLLAEIRNCQAEVHPPNLLVYPDAFDDLDADLVYVNHKAGVEQFVVLQEAPPPPEDFGMDPATTRLEVISEFLDGVRPRKQPQIIRRETDPRRRGIMVEPDFVDERLDFGAMFMGPGRAFLPADDAGRMAAADSLPMAKRWEVIDRRTILFEAVEYAGLKPLLATLSSAPHRTDLARHRRPSNARQVPSPRIAGVEAKPVQMATVGGFPRGVILDYALSTPVPNRVFMGDTTYYISGPVSLTGSNTVFEAGSVIKFAPTNNARLDVLSTKVTWLATPYRPVIFTARDDASVGTALTALAPAGYYAEIALRFLGPVTNVSLANVRFAHAQTALAFPQGGNVQVDHAQFVRCQAAISLGSAQVQVRNALLSEVATCFDLGGGIVRGEHVTVNGAALLNTTPALFLTNSLLVAVAASNTWNGAFNAVLPTAANVFEAAGAGSHYLPEDSPFRDAGTPQLTPVLRADLQRLTTRAPVLLTGSILQSLHLNPRAVRDVDGPDLGYHYVPLDYLVSNVVLQAPLRLSGGVALGLCGTLGFDLQQGSTLQSDGTPTVFNHFVGTGLLQEQPANLGQAKALSLSGVLVNPPLRFRFTDFSLRAGALGVLLDPASLPFAEWALRDCTVACALLQVAPTSGTAVTVTFTNNLLERSRLSFLHASTSQNTPLRVLLFNNLFRGGSLGITYDTGATNPVWSCHDNLFDGASQYVAGTGSSAFFIRSHNGFTSGTTPQLGGSSNRSGLLADFQPGPLGPWYYPTNGSGLNQLRNTGSRTNAALAALYHHTTTTNQVKETNSIVDIGFHYLALDAGGNPVDTDADGIADAVEDANGNGAWDPATETDWQSTPSGVAGPVGLQVFTPLQ